MITRRNIVHGAIFLMTTLLATGGIFLQLQAEFLVRRRRLLVYAGGIMVLFVFVIMLVNLDVEMQPGAIQRGNGPWRSRSPLVLAAQFAWRSGSGATRFICRRRQRLSR